MSHDNTSRQRAFRTHRSSLYRGSGRGTYPSRRFVRASSPEPDHIPVDLGELMETVAMTDVSPVTINPTVIQDVECVASFNWIGSTENPTIAIPGAPPKWAPPKTSPQLTEDSGTYYRDINAAHLPRSPMQATAVAILANTAISSTSIDLVACASTLRSLFSFISGQRKTFRILVEAVGNTVFFVRRENSPHEVLPNVHGYGHSMPEAYTNWDVGVTGSVSSQRVLRYNFAGLDCLVRYECDGYFPDKYTENAVAINQQNVTNTASGAGVDLKTALASVKVSSELITQMKSDLTIKEAGMDVPQSATFELKTRTVKRRGEDFFEEFSSRFWLTQAPYFVLAFHTRGVFKDIQIRDVRSETAAWQSDNQEDIRKLAGLLKNIIRRVKNEPDGMLELWRHERGDMEVHAPGGECYGALPPEIEDLWIGGHAGGVMVRPSD